MTVRKVAHDSGDGQTIYHCPFCGSGQVIARSDRTIECQFCHVCFTVQVQPQFPAFPQTIDGQPVQVPGMPGQIGAPSMGGGMGADPADPDAGMGAGAPMDPSAMDDEGEFPPGGDGEGGEGEDPEGGEDDGDDEDAPPWAKTSGKRWFKTARGHWLDEDDYARYLLINSVPEGLRRSVAAKVKEGRS